MNTQGIGLGLVISEKIVKSFNGNIGVSSKFEVGTIFTFSIELNSELLNQDHMK
jgi:K+-sensing histidine kinase KdpD